MTALNILQAGLFDRRTTFLPFCYQSLNDFGRSPSARVVKLGSSPPNKPFEHFHVCWVVLGIPLIKNNLRQVVHVLIDLRKEFRFLYKPRRLAEIAPSKII